MVVALLPRPYSPWSAQIKFHRSTAPIRCIVAGRQAGKSHSGAEEVVRIMLERPGTTSCLLMPTYKSAQGIMKHVERALKPLGADRWVKHEVKATYTLFNGAVLYVRTSDDKSGVPTRGLTIDGVLWVDEAAYVPEAAWTAARLTQTAIQDPLTIVTTTPAGLNWVYKEWKSGYGSGDGTSSLTESLRFKSLDSPYCNPEFIEDMRRKMGAQAAMQELNAQFLGDAHAAFKQDDIEAMFKPIPKIRGDRLSMGIDLAKEVDWTVLTLMNEFGEAWVIARWRRVDWTESIPKIARLVKKHKAIAVVDHQHGGGYGGTVIDFLKKELGEEWVFPVQTGNVKLKAQVCETLVSDVENRKVWVHGLPNKPGHWDILKHEMTFFGRFRDVKQGVEYISYHGPEGDGEDDHDDTVISLALANWGRIYAWDKFDPLAGDFEGFGGAVLNDGPPEMVYDYADDDEELGGFGGVLL